MTAYANMLKWFGALKRRPFWGGFVQGLSLGPLICRMKKRHVWGRAYQHLNWNDGVWQKECARCGIVVAVKRRKTKENAK